MSIMCLQLLVATVAAQAPEPSAELPGAPVLSPVRICCLSQSGLSKFGSAREYIVKGAVCDALDFHPGVCVDCDVFEATIFASKLNCS